MMNMYFQSFHMKTKGTQNLSIEKMEKIIIRIPDDQQREKKRKSVWLDVLLLHDPKFP